MKIIEIFYGNDYKRLLNEELIILKQEKALAWFFAISMNVLVAVGAVLFWPISECFSYFTDWMMWLSLLLSISLYLCANDRDIKQKFGWLAYCHALFQLCMICNCIVVVIYWTFLHELTLVKHHNYPGRYVHTYFSHSIPFVSTALIWWANDIRLYVNHWKGLNIIAVLYGLWSYLKFMQTGVILYPFLDWRKSVPVLNLTIIAAVFSCVYVLLAYASYWLKPISNHSKIK